MSKKNDKKLEKLTGKQLVETIRDTAYEVLEEELDAQLEAIENSKLKKEHRHKAISAKKLIEAKKIAAEKERAVKKLQEKKQKIKKAYKKLLEEEEKLK